LGFVKKRDFPVGKFKWLTVVSPAEPDGVELLLEPDDNPAAKTFKKAIRGGENRGRMLLHENVVRAFKTVSLKKSAMGQVDFAVHKALVLDNAAVIAYVQDRETHRILGAASVDW
jgi:hypothetical protein